MLYTKELAEQLKKAVDNIEIKVKEDKEWEFDVIATTEDTDRDNEVIKVSGWDTKNWQKNPVVLANHHYTIENIIGKWYKFYTNNGQKRLKGVFSKSNPLGVLAKELYQEWMLKTVSVWFLPLMRDNNDPKIIIKAELLEVSFVAVPCNPNALSLDEKKIKMALKSGLIIEEIEKDEEVITEEEIKQPTANNEEITEIKQELKEIKEILNNLTKTIADDKAKDSTIDEMKSKKDVIQSINKATASVLENLKKL